MTKRPCTIDDCGRESRSRDLCATHYRRLMRHGDAHRGGGIIRQHVSGARCEFCAKSTVARGLCENHYRRWRRCGDPLGGNVAQGVPAAERFWAKVKKTDSCWLWLGAPNNSGYGSIGVDRTTVMAHRYSWILAGNELIAGMHLDHLCRERRCVRPDHLEQVTPAENLARAREAGVERVGSGGAQVREAAATLVDAR